MAEHSNEILWRTFSVIEALGTQPNGLGISKLAEKTGLHKSTVYRLAGTLCEMGYAKKDPVTENYSLSMKFVQLAGLLLSRTELKVVAYPHLKKLAAATFQTVHLCVLREQQAVYLDKVQAYNNSLHMFSAIGTGVPLYSTAVGKCLLAWQPPKTLSGILDALSFAPVTAHTLRTREALLQQLAEVRQQGFASDDEENEAGIRCAAAPVRDYSGAVIAAVSVSGDFPAVACEAFREAAAAVCRTAAAISKDLGCSISPDPAD